MASILSRPSLSPFPHSWARFNAVAPNEVRVIILPNHNLHPILVILVEIVLESFQINSIDIHVVTFPTPRSSQTHAPEILAAQTHKYFRRPRRVPEGIVLRLGYEVQRSRFVGNDDPNSLNSREGPRNVFGTIRE